MAAPKNHTPAPTAKQIAQHRGTKASPKYSGPMIDPNTGKSLIKAGPKPPVSPVKAKGKVTKVSSKSGTDSTSRQVEPEPETFVQSYSPSASASSQSFPDVKAATPDLIQITEEGMSAEIIADLLFEDIGGTEILNVARHDLINGIDIKYQQISNLVKVESNFGGNSLINIQNPIEQIFNKFALKRYQYIPEVTDDPSGLDNHVYLDASGSLNIELINLAENMQVEIEFKTVSTTDIIY